MGCYCGTEPPPPRISVVALQRRIDDNVQCLLLTSGDEHIPHQSMHALDVPHPPGCVKQPRVCTFAPRSTVVKWTTNAHTVHAWPS